MRLAAAILLLIAPTPASAGVREDIAERQAHFSQVNRVQEACERWLFVYVEYSRWNRRNLARYSWDNPDGFVDPSAINRSRYFFQDLSARVRDEIDQIQRSRNPSEEACKQAALQARTEHWRYTCELLTPYDRPGTCEQSYPEDEVQ